MSKERWDAGTKHSLIVVAVLVVIGIVSGLAFANAAVLPQTSPSPTVSVTPSPTPTPDPTVTPPPDPVCDPERTVKEFFLDQAFKPGEVRVGSEVSFRGAPQERGYGSFGFRTLRSQKDVSEFLHRNKPARREVYKALVPRFGKAEFGRAMSGEGYVPVQFTVPVKVFGTTYLMNRTTVVKAKGGRYARANDIFWVFVTEECQVVKAASIRADCSNPNFKAIVPVRGKPPRNVPPISRPPGPVPKKCPSSGICGTPGSGPEFQPPQEDPGYPPGATDPTPGYDPGPDGNTPPTTSDPAPDEHGSPGSGCNNNGCEPGGDDGVSDPDNSDGLDEEPPNDGDPCNGNPDGCI